jgi:hypothetical protein
MNEPERAPAIPASAGAPDRRPAGFCRGPGHLVVYGNPAFVATFGISVVGMPARESLLDLPPTAFALLDAVLAHGRPLARWIKFRGEDWRLTATPRVDPGDGDTYGVTFHMRAKGDVLVVATEPPGPVPDGGAE